MFLYLSKYFFMDNTFRQSLKFDCWQIHFLDHAQTNTGLLDENRKSCCTWNWLVLYGNHVCHSTVHWLLLDNAITKIISSLINTKIWCWNTRKSKWTLRRLSRSCHFPISTISRSWEKYHQKCKMMNVHLIHLNERNRVFPVCN